MKKFLVEFYLLFLEKSLQYFLKNYFCISEGNFQGISGETSGEITEVFLAGSEEEIFWKLRQIVLDELQQEYLGESWQIPQVTHLS